jgi:TP901 family phage tail tape measure protein
VAKEILLGFIIGAKLASSYSSVFGSAQQTIGQIGRATRDLGEKQRKLGADIQKHIGTLAPSSIAALNSQYERLGVTMDRLRAKEERLSVLLTRRKTLREERADLRSQGLETIGTAVAMGAPIAKSVTIAANYQDQIKDIAITGNLGRGAEAQLGTALRKIARRTNQTQEELVKGVGIMVANGMTPAEAQRYAGLLGKSATATRASMDDLAQLMFSLQNQLGVKTEAQMGQALDALAHAGKQGQFELRNMARYFPELGAQMASFGATGLGAVKELGMAMQVARKYAGTNEEAARNAANWFSHMTAGHTVKVFGDVGIDYKAEVMKRVQRGQSAMLASLDTVDTYIDKLTSGKVIEVKGKNGKVKDRIDFRSAIAQAQKNGNEQEVMALVSRFGLSKVLQDMQTVNFYLAMRQGRGMFQSGMKSFDAPEAKGVIDRDYQRRVESASEQWKQFKIGATDVAITLGNALLPALVDLLRKVKPVVERFGAWAEKNPGLLRGIIGLAGGLLAGKLAMIGLGYGLNLVLTPINMVRTAWTLLGAKFALFNAMRIAGRFVPFANTLGRVGGRISLVGGWALKLGRILGSGLATGVRIAGQAVLWLGRALMANPIGLVVTAIGVAAYLVWKHWDKVKAAAIAGLNWAKGLGARFWEAGTHLVDGLVNGVSARIGAARDRIVKFGRSVRDWFANTLGIHSPSRVFVGMGGNIAEGAAIGVTRGTPMVKKAVAGMAALSLAAPALAASGAGGAGGSGGVHIHFNPVIHVASGAPEAVKESVGQALKLSTVELEQMLRRVLAQQKRRAF